MVNLSYEQQVLLRDVEEKDLIWRNKKLVARQEALKQAELVIESANNDRVLAILRAVNAGIPKQKIHTEGLHTKRPNELYDILKQNTATLELISVTEKVSYPRFSWLDAECTQVRIEYTGWSERNNVDQWRRWNPEIGKFEAYVPETLSATIERDGSGWKVLEDRNATPANPERIRPGHPETEFDGGPITIEITGGKLMEELDTWLAENS